MVSLAISLQFVNYYNRAREGGGTGGGGGLQLPPTFLEIIKSY